MHEMGITQGILAASFDAARGAGMTRITEIRIRVGDLTETVDFALQFAFEALTPETMAEGAVLVIEKAYVPDSGGPGKPSGPGPAAEGQRNRRQSIEAR